MARIYGRRSRNVLVVKGIRGVWQAHFTTVFPSSTLGERKPARKHISLEMSSGDRFRSLCTSCRCEMSAIPSVRKAVFGFIPVDSYHYNILQYISDEQNSTSGFSARFLIERRMLVSTNITLYCTRLLFDMTLR